jgi:hypothetical protein
MYAHGLPQRELKSLWPTVKSEVCLIFSFADMEAGPGTQRGDGRPQFLSSMTLTDVDIAVRGVDAFLAELRVGLAKQMQSSGELDTPIRPAGAGHLLP